MNNERMIEILKEIQKDIVDYQAMLNGGHVRLCGLLTQSSISQINIYIEEVEKVESEKEKDQQS